MYNNNNLIHKLSNEVQLFNELFTSNSIEESEKVHFNESLKRIYSLAKELYEETNVLPLLSNVQLRSKHNLDNLTENDINLKMYKHFKSFIESGYITPLNEGTLYDLHHEKSRMVLNSILESDANIDPEISKNYAIFESVMFDALKEIVLPRDNRLSMAKYARSVKPEYYDLFDRNIHNIKQEFNDELLKLAINLANKMYEKRIQFANDVDKDSIDISRYKGLSKIFDLCNDELDEELKKVKITIKIKKEDCCKDEDIDEELEKELDSIPVHDEEDLDNDEHSIDIDDVITDKENLSEDNEDDEDQEDPKDKEDK